MSGTIENLPPYRIIQIESATHTIGGDVNLLDASDNISLQILDSTTASFSYGPISNWNLGTGDFLGLTLRVTNPANALTPAEVDQFLIDLDSYNFNKGPSSLGLLGGFSRTTASDAAFSNLVGAGVSITIN